MTGDLLDAAQSRLAIKARHYGETRHAPASEGRKRVTSAQWRMVEALAHARQPLTAPQIAASVGCTRQGAQKQLNLLMQARLIRNRPNPLHKRSWLYVLTELGKKGFADAAPGGRPRR